MLMGMFLVLYVVNCVLALALCWVSRKHPVSMGYAGIACLWVVAALFHVGVI